MHPFMNGAERQAPSLQLKPDQIFMIISIDHLPLARHPAKLFLQFLVSSSQELLRSVFVAHVIEGETEACALRHLPNVT